MTLFFVTLYTRNVTFLIPTFQLQAENADLRANLLTTCAELNFFKGSLIAEDKHNK